MTKTVLITGVARGIGKAICEKFLNEGYIVHGTFNTSEKEANELQGKYGKEKLILHGSFDFSDLNQTKTFIKEVSDLHFDCIVPSAGMFAENDDFLNFDVDVFNKTMYCNFYTPMMICTMLKDNINDNGSIVIMSSNDAYPGAFGSMSYSISKSALISLMKCLCVNFGNRKVRVNSVAPGAINTDMNTPEQEFEAPLYTPIERIGQPAEVAEVVYFLASENASFINGENVTIDGGYNIVSILLKNEAKRMRG
jgi:NAD(P)-dependent dehydrogenase (short-subunit alcohol dehydrogenase family)